jgi:MFS family permease
MNKNIFKSVGAVLAGFVAVAILSVATDFVFETLGIFPDAANPELYASWMLGIALVYRSIFTVVGGYLTAKFAPQNPMHHIYVLMVLGLIGGVAGAVSGWHLGNHWYPVLLAVTGPLFVWLGGKLLK